MFLFIIRLEWHRLASLPVQKDSGTQNPRAGDPPSDKTK